MAIDVNGSMLGCFLHARHNRPVQGHWVVCDNTSVSSNRSQIHNYHHKRWPIDISCVSTNENKKKRFKRFVTELVRMHLRLTRIEVWTNSRRNSTDHFHKKSQKQKQQTPRRQKPKPKAKQPNRHPHSSLKTYRKTETKTKKNLVSKKSIQNTDYVSFPKIQIFFHSLVGPRICDDSIVFLRGNNTHSKWSHPRWQPFKRKYFPITWHNKQWRRRRQPGDGWRGLSGL